MTTPQVHVDRVLTDAAVAFFRRAEYVAGQACPPVPTERQSDRYMIWDRNDFSRDEAKRRANGAEAAVTYYRRSTDTFDCQRWALKTPLIPADMANDEDPAGYEQGAVELVTGSLAIRRERLFLARALLNTSWNASNRFVGTAATDDDLLQFIRFTQANNDPIRVMARAHDYVRRGTNGQTANVLVVSPNVHTSFLYNSAILERIKYGGGPGNPAMITPQMLAAVFGVEKYLVPNAVYASNVEGATAAYADVASNAMLLAYLPSKSSKFAPAAMKQFSWSKYDKAQSAERATVVRFRHAEKDDTEFIETEIAVDFKITADTAAVHFASVLS